MTVVRERGRSRGSGSAGCVWSSPCVLTKWRWSCRCRPAQVRTPGYAGTGKVVAVGDAQLPREHGFAWAAADAKHGSGGCRDRVEGDQRRDRHRGRAGVGARSKTVSERGRTTRRRSCSSGMPTAPDTSDRATGGCSPGCHPPAVENEQASATTTPGALRTATCGGPTRAPPAAVATGVSCELLGRSADGGRRADCR